MAGVVVAEQYRFVPPRRGSLWPRLIALLLPRYLRRSHGVLAVRCRGVRLLRASVAAGDGVMLAPNHCRPCDPMVLGMLAREAGCLLTIMASWHLFRQGRFQAWVLPRAGVFSVHREGLDREALRCAVAALVDASRPLVVFPEGVISRHNDRLNHLMEGAAFIAQAAARQRAAARPPGRVAIHPVAIRYAVEGEVGPAVEPVLGRLERRLGWRPRRGRPLVERVLELGGAMLALKEIEHLGEPGTGPIAARVGRLADHLLGPIEREWVGGRREEGVVARVKLVRAAIVPGLAEGGLGAEEAGRRWAQLEDAALAQQLSCYPAGYFTPAPTPERILETVERFEEDSAGTVPPLAGLRALVDVGEAIPVEPRGRRGGGEEALTARVRERLQELLAASLEELHPGVGMA